jgi:hypothetical protein
VVMVVSMGSILIMLNSNRKSQAERTVIDNLSYTMDDMVRTVRFGTVYHCGSSGTLSNPQDCLSGNISLTVLNSSGVQTTYTVQNGAIVRTDNTGTFTLTSSDTIIQSLTFYVSGSTAYPNLLQPRVIMVVRGLAGVSGNNSQSPFSLETMVSQRKLDL